MLDLFDQKYDNIKQKIIIHKIPTIMFYLEKENVTELLDELSSYDVAVLNVKVLAACVGKIRIAIEDLSFAPNAFDTEIQTNLLALKSYQKIFETEFVEVRGGSVVDPYQAFVEMLKVDRSAVEESLRLFDDEGLGNLIIVLDSFPKKQNPVYEDLRELCYEIMGERIDHIPCHLLLDTIAEYEALVKNVEELQGILDLMYKSLADKNNSAILN